MAGMSESKLNLYKRRRAAGQCVQCGADAGGKSKCAKCYAKACESKQRLAARRKAEGKCVTCGKPAKDGCVTCQACIDRTSQSVLNWQRRNKAEGRCRICGKPLDNELTVCSACLPHIRELARKHYHRNKGNGTCYNCHAAIEPGQIYCRQCRDNMNEAERQRNHALRDDVFYAYGGYKCAYCGLDNPDVMQIDHIAGGGRQHLKQINNQLYKWLKKNGYPKGFQVLCANCNMQKARHATEAKTSRRRVSTGE